MGRLVVGEGPLVGTVRVELAPAWVVGSAWARERVVEPRAWAPVAVESVWVRTTARAQAPV